MSYMQKMTTAMERLANLKGTPADICDWAEQRYAELMDRTATVSVPDLKHMSEYTDAIEAEDSDGFRQSLDNISGYLRRRQYHDRGMIVIESLRHTFATFAHDLEEHFTVAELTELLNEAEAALFDTTANAGVHAPERSGGSS